MFSLRKNQEEERKAGEGWKKLLSWAEGDMELPEPEEAVPIREPEKEREHKALSRLEMFSEKKAGKLYAVLYRLVALGVCVTMILVLLALVGSLPSFGNPANPGNNEVYRTYVENALEDTGALNVVCGLILNYRGYDTLNEAHVLFVAVCAVMVLLRLDHQKGVVMDRAYEATEKDEEFEPKDDPILQKSAMILVPFILLFGVNIMLNGHLSPGGGFSGGAIAGGGLLLYLIAFGFQKARHFFNEHVYHVVKTSALLIYTVLMTYFIFMGANQLSNGISLGTPGAVFSGGIMLPINLVVGLEVACTMYGLFAFFRKGGL